MALRWARPWKTRTPLLQQIWMHEVKNLNSETVSTCKESSITVDKLHQGLDWHMQFVQPYTGHSKHCIITIWVHVQLKKHLKSSTPRSVVLLLSCTSAPHISHQHKNICLFLFHIFTAIKIWQRHLLTATKYGKGTDRLQAEQPIKQRDESTCSLNSGFMMHTTVMQPQVPE